MKTNAKSKVLGLLVLGALFVGSSVKAANDPPAFKGTFTLQSEIHWGVATLPAGDYSFTLDRPGGMITISSGTKGVAMVLTSGVSDAKSDRCEMILDDGAVREVNLPQLGVSLHYRSPNPRRRSAPQEVEASRVIPVAVVASAR